MALLYTLCLSNVTSMQNVFYEACPLIKSGVDVFIQGSMFDDHLLFQLCWKTNNTLEIVQVGVFSKKRRNKYCTRWFHEIMDAIKYYRFRLIAKNVENKLICSKLQEYGFKYLGNNDFSFPL
jgi:hypothetical protein